MRLHLFNGYFIDVDEFNWALKCVVTIDEYEDKNGKVIAAHDVEKVVGYYGCFKDAVEGALKHNVKALTKDMELSIKDYVNLVEKANNEAIDIVYKQCAWVEDDAYGGK